MFGYVLPDREEIRVADLRIYNAYYCGVCKTIGRRYGQAVRAGLTYDIVFLALVLAGLDPGINKIENRHCIIHHISKKAVLDSEPALDYAADIMILLGACKVQDDIDDGERRNYPSLMMKKSKKVRAVREKEYESVCRSLAELRTLEHEKASLDDRTDRFASIMETIFLGYKTGHERELAVMAGNLGRWIYVVDALDDFVEDKKNGRSNPLRDEPIGAENIEDAAVISRPVIYNYLGQISMAYDLLPIGRNKGVLDNIIYLGLRRVSEDILNGKEIEHGKRPV